MEKVFHLFGEVQQRAEYTTDSLRATIHVTENNTGLTETVLLTENIYKYHEI